MKNTILSLVLSCCAISVQAHGDYRGVERAIIGIAIGYGVAQATAQVNRRHEPQVIIVQNPPQPRVIPLPPPRPVYRESIEYSPDCDCNVRILRQIGWQ